MKKEPNITQDVIRTDSALTAMVYIISLDSLHKDKFVSMFVEMEQVGEEKVEGYHSRSG